MTVRHQRAARRESRQQSPRPPKDGGGFDYHLIPADANRAAQNENFFAEASARLEVSGILRGELSDVNRRFRSKQRRASKRPAELPLFVGVVEFSQPVMHLDQV